jgi:two-component system, LytTR family, sensor kinase
MPAVTLSVSPRREAWGFGLLLLGFWSLVALLQSSEIYLKMLSHGHSWWHLFLWHWVLWALWAALTPVVLSLARRYRLDRAPRLRHLLLHTAAAVALSALHLLPVAVATIVLRPYAPVEEPGSFGREYAFLAISWLHVDFLVYWAILGVGYAYDYRQRLRERDLRTSQLQAQLARSQVAALQLQIHPHFLFNSLNAVAGLVRKGRSEQALSLLAGLGDLLRYVLDSAETPFVPLEKELAFASRYLEIQQVRFSDRLESRLDVAPELLGTLVPTLILQPLVENAIEHGIACEGGGAVEIRAREEPPRLRLSVRDNGPGLEDPRRDGLGLANTRARLKEIYGVGAEVRLDEDEGGVTVSLTLPLAPVS